MANTDFKGNISAPSGFVGPIMPTGYTVATRPAHTAIPNRLIYVSDGTSEGVPALAFAGGTGWHEVALNGRGPKILPAYTVATLPVAADNLRQLVFVTDGDAGNPCLAVAGTAGWYRIALGALVSTS